MNDHLDRSDRGSPYPDPKTDSVDQGAVDDLLARPERFLSRIDGALDEAEKRKDLERQKECASLENRFFDLRGLREELTSRLERARQAELSEIVAEIEGHDRRLEVEIERILGRLGYDPEVRREEERQRREQQYTEASARQAGQFLDLIEHVSTEDDLEEIAEKILPALPDLRLSDARRIVQAIDRTMESRHWEGLTAAGTLLGVVLPFEDDEQGEEAFRAEMVKRQERDEELAKVDRTVDELVQEAILLETQAATLSVDALACRIHEICCRAKLLQQDGTELLTPAHQDDLFRRVFGRLRAIHRDHGCPYVAGLSREWMPESLEVEIERARREFKELAGRPGSGDPAPAEPSTPDELDLLRKQVRTLQRRLDEADRWVLAAVYRRANRVVDDPGDDVARERLRRTVSYALDFLEGARREGLPELLLQIEEVFEQGSQFRWLRSRFRRLTEAAARVAEEDSGVTAAEEQAVEDDFDEPTSGRIEALDGEKIIHPSVLRALPSTRGKHLAVLGGPSDESRRQSLEELLEASRVDWIPHERGDGTRLCQTLVQRVESGGIDLVVLLTGFLGHKNTIPVLRSCRELGVPAAIVPRGRGEVGIATAIASLTKTAGAAKEDSAGA